MSKSMHWYWRRLKCMSPAEIGYRIKKTMYMNAQRFGWDTANEVPLPDLSQCGAHYLGESPNINTEPYLTAADLVINGHMRVFALEDGNLGVPPQWNRDPLSGKQAPMVFGKTLNYRDPGLVGDIKYLWEPNRHLQLVVLAQAFQLTGNKRYLNSLREQLDSWLVQCPYLMGPNWTSSLELGIRLINWNLIWQMVGGKDSSLFQDEEGKQFLGRWLSSIYQHGHFIAGHLSGYSSANNHLIGEAAGLFVASTTWPYWSVCKSWQKQSKSILEKEALLQNAPDGVNREQAISYQQFVLDFLLISGLAGKANKIDFSSEYWNRIEHMLEFVASVMDVQGNIPMIGDADDGYVVNLSQQEDWCPYRSLLATGAIIFDRGDFKAKSKALDDKTLWLLGGDADTRYDAIILDSSSLPIRRSFPDGGYYIMGNDFETEEEIRLVIDAGPLGYQGIAAHGHADALSFTLSIGGLEFLVDPGTYAYHTQKKWRDYFRGTSAHNTIRIDGCDQSESGGNFMWLQKASAFCEIWDVEGTTERFVGTHDGYARLEDAVNHRREITLNKKERLIVVTDTLTCKGSHEVECYWHFSEGCKVTITDSGVEAQYSGKKLTLDIEGSSDKLELICGDEERPGGWISRRYDVKNPTQAVVLTKDINGNSSIKTKIYYH